MCEFDLDKDTDRLSVGVAVILCSWLSVVVSVIDKGIVRVLVALAVSVRESLCVIDFDEEVVVDAVGDKESENEVVFESLAEFVSEFDEDAD